MFASCAGYLSPSPSSDSTSTRYSHLSTLTSSSSISSVSSPPLSPAVSVHSIGSKTSAFFSSPFDGSPSPLPPPNPHKRPSSVRSKASVTSLSSQASASDGASNAGADDTPRIPQRAPKRSLNDTFFGPSALPTPPPSIARLPGSSRESSLSPPPTLQNLQTLPLLPLSRLFPSRRRYGTEGEAPTSPTQESSSAQRRMFLQLDTGAVPHGYPGVPAFTEGYTASPAMETGSLAPAPPDSSDMPTPQPGASDSAQTAHPLPAAAPAKIPFPTARPESAPAAPPALAAGVVLSSASLSVRLERVLGHGAFSSVWLARDVQGQLGALELSRKTSLLRSRSEKRGRTRCVEGARPKAKAKRGVLAREEDAAEVHPRDAGDESVYLSETDGRAVPALDGREGAERGRLVAVKMTERALCEKNSRSRVSFVREVEILRHIAHSSIVSYVHSFSTPSHHCLVLEYVGGGELFDLIDNAENHARLDEPLLRRMFGELCKAVGWMHGVGLVHRDIKLENILLTTPLFTSPLPAPPDALIKLSDFGLSRFIDPAQPLLTTLCGSESYAAPELVTGRPYDGRETDAWACGVVLYALATRRLPFDRPRARAASREREAAQPARPDARTRDAVRAERRALLVRIAKGEYAWPEDAEAAGAGLARSEGVRRVVERLLVRDPRKRAKIIDLWEDEWMRGEGAPLAPATAVAESAVAADEGAQPDGAEVVEGGANGDTVELDAVEEDDDDGLIVDGQDIGPGSVAHQEH